MVPGELLRLIGDEPRLTPIEMSKRLKRNVAWIRNIVSIMQELRLVDTPARGVYTITKLGEAALQQIEVEKEAI